MPNEETPLWPNRDPTQRFTKMPQHIWQNKWKNDQPKFNSSCVPTCLAMLAKMESKEVKTDRQWVEEFDEKTSPKKPNTQNPVEWSAALKTYNLKLAYLPTDVRPLYLYLDELIGYDGLFMLGFYTGRPDEILEDRDIKVIMNRTEKTIACELTKNQIAKDKVEETAKTIAKAVSRKYQTGSSHVVLLHKNNIYDPAINPAVQESPMEAKAWLKHKLDHYGKTTGAKLHTKRLFRVVPIAHERGL